MPLPGHGVHHPPPSSTEVKERVQLYLYSPSGPSCPVLEWTLPLGKPLTVILPHAACEPAHNMGMTLCHKKVGDLWVKLCLWQFYWASVRKLSAGILHKVVQCFTPTPEGNCNCPTVSAF